MDWALENMFLVHEFLRSGAGTGVGVCPSCSMSPGRHSPLGRRGFSSTLLPFGLEITKTLRSDVISSKILRMVNDLAFKVEAYDGN